MNDRVMQKTIWDVVPENFDRKVNDFKNNPEINAIATTINTEVISGQICYIATIFYKER